MTRCGPTATLKTRCCASPGASATSNVELGGRLLIRMGNSADYALVFLGAIAAGLVPIPASSDLSASEIAFILEDSGASVVVHSHGLDLPSAADALITLDAGDIARFKRGLQGGYADTGADDPAYMVYTSGTSGRPKGVLHGHRAIWGRRPMYSGWYDRIGADDVTLHTGAFNWSYTMGTGLFDPWANGATAVLYTGAKDIQAWPALIARIKPSIMASVPTLYRQMLKHCAIDADTFSSLRLCLVAGEALPPGVAEAWRAATGLGLCEALGMSEISTYLSTSPAMAARPGSPGRPQPGRSVAILPVEGGTTPCPAGETGVIAVHRSDPGMMLGYWNRPDEEAEVFRGDWFCGGDLGAMDDDGYHPFPGPRQRPDERHGVPRFPGRGGDRARPASGGGGDRGGGDPGARRCLDYRSVCRGSARRPARTGRPSVLRRRATCRLQAAT